MRSTLVLPILLVFAFCTLALACGGGGGGGGKLVVGNIEGPSIVNEGGTAVQYHVDASGDTGITYQWAIDPPSAGSFKVNGSATTAFIAAPRSNDTYATIRVVVNSDNSDSVVKEKDIEIKDVEALTVGEIQGPPTVTENTSTDYTVTAEGDTGIKYQWECTPTSAGTFTNPKSPHCVFDAGPVTVNTSATLKVSVRSDNYGPVVKTLNIQIKDANKLVVGDITGPVAVYENSSTKYSITASGDTGITYQWACIPASAGSFVNPQNATTTFNSMTVYADTLVTVQVTVDSDNFTPVVKQIDVTIKDVNALIVLDISGPPAVNENTTAGYSITAGGDTGITYVWECEPAEPGYLTDETTYSPTYNANTVDADMPVTLKVTVSSDNYSPEVRTANITVKNVVLVVGQISGPVTPNEDSNVHYSASATGDTGIAFQWECIPPSAGEFANPTAAITDFDTGFVGADTPATIQVTVVSDNYGPEVRTLDITILETKALWVGDIEGPDSVDEDASVDFGVSATNDSGLTYLWECEPAAAGSFVNETSASCTFHAAEVGADTVVTIKVTVGSDNYTPQVKTKDIQVVNLVIIVGDILGPTAVDEDTDHEYSVTASGDTGITYLWECVPAAAGSFVNGDTDTAIFHAGPIYIFQACTIKVTVGSDHNAPQVKTLDVDIDDTVVLTVGDIQGPTIIDENTQSQYSVAADGDTGITYLWECVPPSAGSFTEPLLASTFFDPVPTGIDTQATLKVTVSADHYAPIEKTLDIDIWDLTAHGYARTWGSAGSDAGYKVVVDQAGNVLVAGAYSGTVDLDPGSGVEEHTSNGDVDIFLSKFTPAGNLVWARTWGGTDEDRGLGVAVNAAGEIYVTGFFRNAVDFDPGPDVFQFASLGGKDVFVSKFSPSGDFLWVNTWGGTGTEEGKSVTVAPTGNVFVTGFFTGTVDFDPTPAVDYHTSSGYEDVFLSKFDASGNFQLAYPWGSTGTDVGYGIVSDSLSNVYIAGDFRGPVDFDPDVEVYERVSHNNGTDVFLSKFNASDDFEWAWNWDAYSAGVAVDSAGNPIVTGYFEGAVDFDPSPGVDEHMSNGSDDVFTCKMTSSGNYVWARTWGGTSDDSGGMVAADQTGNVYVTGWFRNTVDFDPGPGTDEQTAIYGPDAFVSKLDSTGTYVWSRVWGGPSDDVGQGVAASGSICVYVTGYYESSVDFYPGSEIEILTSNGYEDVFLLKFLAGGSW